MARARNLPIIETVTLRGPVTVAYKRCREGFMCTALQFDILGIGRTKREAFQEMRDLVEEYLEEIVRSPEPVCFFNPSDAAALQAPARGRHHGRGVLLEVANRLSRLP